MRLNRDTQSVIEDPTITRISKMILPPNSEMRHLKINNKTVISGTLTIVISGIEIHP